VSSWPERIPRPIVRAAHVEISAVAHAFAVEGSKSHTRAAASIAFASLTR